LRWSHSISRRRRCSAIFVGVDIFFVISGYLITGIIQSEVKGGSFSLAQFYERPALRNALAQQIARGIALVLLHDVRCVGQISYSLYLWHWPLSTFARFSKNSLVLDASDKIALFALTVAISSLSWQFVEQPFRKGRLSPTRCDAIRIADLASAVLLASDAGGMVLSRTPSDADRDALQLESHNT